MPPSLPNGLVNLLRPRQWIKSGVCLAGAFFSGRIFQSHAFFRGCLATAAFCVASSFVYIINDILDRERDRKHPIKKSRPIASGQVSIPQALALAAVLAVIAAAIGACLNSTVLCILGGYALLNIAYSAALKNLSLVDATVVAIGFILRIYAGTSAVAVSPSAWILLCTFFLALFLAFGKRRAEISAVLRQRAALSASEELEAPDLDISTTRGVLHKYSIVMLDRFCNICATLTIAAYALFTVLGHANHTLIITTPPVVMGIFRYLLLVERDQEGEIPEAVLAKDWAIQFAILVWAFLYIAILYGGLKIDVQ